MRVVGRLAESEDPVLFATYDEADKCEFIKVNARISAGLCLCNFYRGLGKSHIGLKLLRHNSQDTSEIIKPTKRRRTATKF